MKPPQRSRSIGPTDPDVRLLQALGDPTRLAIVRQLASDGQVCACDFSDCCGVSQPTVSHHLRVLREAGVVEGERRGTWVYYRLTARAATSLRRLADSLAPAIPLRTGDEPARPGRSLPVLS